MYENLCTYECEANSHNAMNRPTYKCGVCGDTAFNKNFGAFCCESCKSFFRRNAIKHMKQRQCNFNGSCKLDKITRSFCGPCRLAKCFAIGMSQDKILCNKRRKDTFNETQTYSLSSHSRDSIDLQIGMASIPQPMPKLNGHFNSIEYERLYELFSALNIDKKPLTLDNSCQLYRSDNILLALVEQELCHLFAATRCISAFQKMCANDQLSLLKYGFFDVHCMRTVLWYNVSAHVWTVDLGNNQFIHVNVDMETEGRDIPHITHVNHLQTFGQECHSDACIIDLLAAITLFNPDRPNLIHKRYVKLQQQMYMHLLQRYLQLKTPSDSGAGDKYQRLMYGIDDMNAMNRTCIQYTNPKRENLGNIIKDMLYAM